MNICRIFPETDSYQYISTSGASREERNSIIMGKVLTSKIEFNIQLENKEKKLPEILGIGTSEFFFSERAMNLVLSKIPTDSMNFLPTRIGGKSYFLMNLIGLKEITDPEESVFEYYSNGNIKNIKKLVLVEDHGLSDFEIFRLKSRPIHVFITQAMRELFVKENICGISYLESKDLTVFE